MYVGFDIGGTTIKYGLLNEAGGVSAQSAIDTPSDKETLLNELVAIVEDYKKITPDLLGVGISAPGIIQKDGFMLTAGAIKTLYGTNLKLELEQRLHLPVAVENDGNAAAIAERWQGNAQKIDNYLCIVLGTGLGAGIVLNGDVYRGQHGMAGEFGWMLIDALPKEGNIELVSMNWRGAVILGLCRRYSEALQEMNPEATPIIDARVIFKRRQEGEVLAEKMISEYLRDLSVMLINLVSVFDPERILIGGGISANQGFMKELQATFSAMVDRHDSLHYLKDKTVAKILPAYLQNNAGMMGAVYQIHRQLEKEKRGH